MQNGGHNKVSQGESQGGCGVVASLILSPVRCDNDDKLHTTVCNV